MHVLFSNIFFFNGVGAIALLTPSEPQSRFGGQTTYNSTGLSPKRDCGPERVHRTALRRQPQGSGFRLQWLSRLLAPARRLARGREAPPARAVGEWGLPSRLAQLTLGVANGDAVHAGRNPGQRQIGGSRRVPYSRAVHVHP